jgi:hypothetical protein
MIIVKFHENVVAVCDSGLIGKTVEDDKRRLDITERFYKGEKKSKKDVLKIMSSAANMNIVGPESIRIALKEGFINKDDLIVIKGVPHAQVYSV